MEAWLEAVSASAIFRDNGFGPEVTEVLVLLTREGQSLMYGVSSFLAEGCQESKVLVGQAYSPGAEVGL